jgi:hypothetical protein
MKYTQRQIAANAVAYEKAIDDQKYAREHLTLATHKASVVQLTKLYDSRKVSCDYNMSLSCPVFICKDGRINIFCINHNADMFPAHYDRDLQTCLMCGILVNPVGPYRDIRVYVGMYYGYACYTCYASLPVDKHLCPRTIEPIQTCIETQKARRQMITLCLQRSHAAMCRDIRKVILQMCMVGECNCK